VVKAGLGSLNEGDKVSYEIVANRGKDSTKICRGAFCPPVCRRAVF
jgi:cold shock CspA family protein